MLNDDTKEYRQKKNDCERTKRQKCRDVVSPECRPQKDTSGADWRTVADVRMEADVRTAVSVRGTFNASTRTGFSRLFSGVKNTRTGSCRSTMH